MSEKVPVILNDLARNSTELTFRGNTVVKVYELKLETAYGILKLMKGRDESGMDVEEIVDLVLEKTTEFTNLPKDQFMKLTFSELKQVRKAFKEVNTDFLETLESMGMALPSLQVKEEELESKSTPLESSESPTPTS